MKSKKGIDIVTSVGTRLYDAFVNASTSGMKRVVTTVWNRCWSKSNGNAE